MVDAPLDSDWEKTLTRDLAVGRTVGEYVIRRRIGEGGMGIVYEAEHPQIGRRVAIKIIRPDREVTRDLLMEARAVSLIRHRHIIDVFGFGHLEGLGQYLVMDFLEGNPLDEEIRGRAPLSPTEVIGILDDTLAALSAAHAKNVIHRDLKPGNLFFVRESNGTRYVKVLDFGLAKPPPASVPPERQTQEGIAMGTPEYMAPEQAQAKAVDGRTDLYALGVIAFELLTGRLPFSGAGPLETAMMQVSDPPPRPRSVNPSIPTQLEDLVLQLLAKDPNARPPSADAVRGELKRIRRDLASEPTPIGKALPPEAFDLPPTEVHAQEAAPTIDAAARVPDTEPPELTAPRPKLVLPLALGTGALLVAGLAAFLWVRQQRPPVDAPPVIVPPPPAESVPVAAPPSPPTQPEVQDMPPQGPTEEPQKVPVKRPAPPPARKPGQLQVIAHTCSVEVFVDGKSVGHTPMAVLTLSAGEHSVKMVNALCTPVVDERVRITPGATFRLERDFVKK